MIVHNNNSNTDGLMILVSQRIDLIEDYGEYRDALDQMLTIWLAEIGLTPIPVPNTLTKVQLNLWIEKIDASALVLSGGNDLGEYPNRDRTEGDLLDWAEKHRIPVLGICRGMQFMVKWFGGELVEVSHHVGIRHTLEKIMHQEILPDEVNSYHNWGFKECPSQFKVMARTEDGVIEAIRHDSLPWEGWMWHPERENPFIKEDLDRIKQLFRIKN